MITNDGDPHPCSGLQLATCGAGCVMAEQRGRDTSSQEMEDSMVWCIKISGTGNDENFVDMKK